MAWLKLERGDLINTDHVACFVLQKITTGGEQNGGLPDLGVRYQLTAMSPVAFIDGNNRPIPMPWFIAAGPQTVMDALLERLTRHIPRRDLTGVIDVAVLIGSIEAQQANENRKGLHRARPEPGHPDGGSRGD